MFTINFHQNTMTSGSSFLHIKLMKKNSPQKHFFRHKVRHMGQNSSSVPAKKLFVSDFLESPRNYCPSEPLSIPLRESLYYDGLSVYRGSNFQPFTAHADTQLTITSTKVIQINFFMEFLGTFFHQLYAESNGFR